MVGDRQEQGIDNLSRTRAARLPVVSNALLVAVKLAVGMLTGSLAVMAEAAHSLIDLIVAAITLYSVRISRRPADESHPFGHGQIEAVTAGAQAVLVFGAATALIYLGITRLLDIQPVRTPELGILAMALSAVANYLITRFLRRASRGGASPALASQARHLSGDVHTSSAVLVGLTAMWSTGALVIDPALAIGVALYMCWQGWIIVRRAVRGLVDEKLPAAEEAVIQTCILEHGRNLVGFHALRTRRAGHQRYIDVHLVVRRHASLEDAHRVCDHLENDITRLLPRSNVIIHCEPCQPEECDKCGVTCDEHPNHTARS